MGTFSATIAGITAKGRTKTEARMRAEAEIQDKLDGRWTPRLIRGRSASVLIWREPSGWCFQVIRGSEDAESDLYGCRGIGSFEGARRSAHFKLAKADWKPEDRFTIPPVFYESDMLTRKSEFVDWIAFQMTRVRVDRENRRIKAAFDRLDADPAIRDRLTAKSYGDRPLIGYVDFCRKYAGHAGQLRAARMIEAAI